MIRHDEMKRAQRHQIKAKSKPQHRFLTHQQEHCSLSDAEVWNTLRCMRVKAINKSTVVERSASDVDQSNWQSAIAVQPASAGKEYLLGGICWFAIPFSFVTSLDLASTALMLPITADDARSALVPLLLQTIFWEVQVQFLFRSCFSLRWFKHNQISLPIILMTMSYL